MKIIISILFIFMLFSCECINDLDTPKENIPDQNSDLLLINLSNNNKILDSYSNDIYIEKLHYKEVKNNSIKYLSGNSVLNFRNNQKVILANSISLDENQKYIGVIFELNSSLLLLYDKELSVNNFRIWNLNNEISSLRVFSNNVLENFEIPLRQFTIGYDLPNGNYQLIYSKNGELIERNISIKPNKKYEICLLNNELIDLEIN